MFQPSVVFVDVPWHLRSADVHTHGEAEKLHQDYERQAAAAREPAPPDIPPS